MNEIQFKYKNETDWCVEFGKRLRRVREKCLYNRAPMSVSEFARNLDVKRQSISNYEDGASIPSAFFIYKVSQLTGVSPAYLLGLQESMSDAAREQVKYTHMDALALAEIKKNLKDDPNKRTTFNQLVADTDFWSIIDRLSIFSNTSVLEGYTTAADLMFYECVAMAYKLFARHHVPVLFNDDLKIAYQALDEATEETKFALTELSRVENEIKNSAIPYIDIPEIEDNLPVSDVFASLRKRLNNNYTEE